MRISDWSSDVCSSDLLALAYEGDSETLSGQLRTSKDIESIFRRAQAAFNAWSVLPAEKRTATEILSALDFDFFELLDSVTIARTSEERRVGKGCDSQSRSRWSTSH